MSFDRVNKKGQSPIVLRIIYREERRDLYTGLYCLKDDWDVETGRVNATLKYATTINKNLELINHQALNRFDELKFTGNPFSLDELVDKLKGKEDKPTLLIDYLQNRNKELQHRAGVDIVQATYEKYERILRYMIDFLEDEYKAKNYLLSKIDGKFPEKYFHYLRTTRTIANNTAVKYMTSLKTILMPAIRNGAIMQDPYLQTKFRSKTIYIGFLTDEEIKMLTEVKLPNPDLRRIRDQYLFCCYTGLAYSDLKQLGREHFIPQKDDEYADYYLFKLGQWISKETEVFGSAQACGSGATQYLSLFDLGWKARDDSPFQPTQEAFYIANLLAHERETMHSYEKGWGAGFETAYFVNGGFKKVENVVYVMWQGKFTEKGVLKYLQPNLFLYGHYENDLLILSAIDIEKGEIFEEKDTTIFWSKDFKCHMYIVPKINETRNLNRDEIEQKDYSFTSSMVAQGFSKNKSK